MGPNGRWRSPRDAMLPDTQGEGAVLPACADILMPRFLDKETEGRDIDV